MPIAFGAKAETKRCPREVFVLEQGACWTSETVSELCDEASRTDGEVLNFSGDE